MSSNPRNYLCTYISEWLWCCRGDGVGGCVCSFMSVPGSADGCSPLTLMVVTEPDDVTGVEHTKATAELREWSRPANWVSGQWVCITRDRSFHWWNFALRSVAEVGEGANAATVQRLFVDPNFERQHFQNSTSFFVRRAPCKATRVSFRVLLLAKPLAVDKSAGLRAAYRISDHSAAYRQPSTLC